MKLHRKFRIFIGGMLFKILTEILTLYSVPMATMAILGSNRIHKSYNMSFLRKLALGLKMWRNTRCISTGTAYQAHLAMAQKLLEIPPDVAGDVIECGTWKGGSATNLSLICRIVGRKLIVYDSFEGLPEACERIAKPSAKGFYLGTLDEVKDNIRRYGVIECCEFVKGWFKDTLPKLNSPVVLAFLDVDYESSLHTCVRYIWPNLVELGYIFTDESVLTDYAALFYSEKWWQKYFDRTPPGLIGAGSGLPLGQYYVGPWPRQGWYEVRFQQAIPVAYTQKTNSGYWTYYPEDS